MESTNKPTPTSKLPPDEPTFLSALAFLVSVGRPVMDGAARIGPSSPVLPSLSVSLTQPYFLQPSNFWKQCIMLILCPRSPLCTILEHQATTSIKQSKYEMNYKQKKHQ
jgi:hypothetical protein